MFHARLAEPAGLNVSRETFETARQVKHWRRGMKHLRPKKTFLIHMHRWIRGVDNQWLR